MFSDFRLAYYRFTLQVGEGGLVLPPFKGDLLRQEKFETLLRRHSCITARRECVSRCLARTTCPYAFLFKEVEAGPLSYRNFHPIPPPVAWHPPPEKKTDYVTGENIYFHLALAGQGISFLDKFIIAMRELGEEGLASGGHFSLRSVLSLCPLSGTEQTVYNYGNKQLTETDLFISGSKLEAWSEAQRPLKRFQILFLTPTGLQVQGEDMQEPLFPVLVRELFRKASLLYYFFHNYKEMDINYRELLRKADKVQTVKDHTRFNTGEKRGSVYGKAVGLLGEVGYSNLDPDFLPLFKLGEYMNLGAQAAFGLGRYRLKIPVRQLDS